MLQAEIADDLEIGRLRARDGLLALGFSVTAQCLGGSKEEQIFWGHVGGFIGARGGNIVQTRSDKRPIPPDPDVQWPGRRDQHMQEWSR
jgi:hypothetical protein